MSEEIERTNPKPLPVDRLSLLWRRVADHRIVQWTAGYVAVGYAIQHAVTLTGEAFDWPHEVTRISMLLLFLGLPVAMTLAWYHGAQTSRRISAGEMTTASLLLVLISLVFYVFVGPANEAKSGAPERAAAAAPVREAGIAAARAASADPHGAIKAVAGQAFHKAFEVMFDPAQRDLPTPAVDAVEAFHKIYDPAFARLQPENLEPGLMPGNLERLLKRWIEMHPAPMLPWKKVLMVEEAFVSHEWDFGDTLVRLIVRPDMVVEDEFGKVRWVDTKSTGSRIMDPLWRKTLRLSLQVKLYSDAVVQKFGERAIYGGWINAIEVRKLPNEGPPKLKQDGTPAKPRNCAEHKVPYAECGNEHAKTEFIECLTTQEMVERAVRDAHNAAETFVWLTRNGVDLETVSMNGTGNGSCRFCPASDWCDRGRPNADGALESFFIYEPWPIETGRRAAA
jgi:hypothetical protein